MIKKDKCLFGGEYMDIWVFDAALNAVAPVVLMMQFGLLAMV